MIVEDDVFGFAEKTIEVGVRMDAGNDVLVGFEQNHDVRFETFAFVHGHKADGLSGARGAGLRFGGGTGARLGRG